jgi:pyrroloquinoline quinone (PQQ) biosynthesis protein C
VTVRERRAGAVAAAGRAVGLEREEVASCRRVLRAFGSPATATSACAARARWWSPVASSLTEMFAPI